MPVDPARVGLDDHVDDVLRHLTENDLRDVVLVGHSYSGLVVGQAAAEVRQIRRDGGWWAPPTPAELAHEPDLDDVQPAR